VHDFWLLLDAKRPRLAVACIECHVERMIVGTQGVEFYPQHKLDCLLIAAHPESNEDGFESFFDGFPVGYGYRIGRSRLCLFDMQGMEGLKRDNCQGRKKNYQYSKCCLRQELP